MPDTLPASIGTPRASMLPGGEPWVPDTAMRLVFDADVLFEELKIDGKHPAIQKAAAMVNSAYARRDIIFLRLAIADFLSLARKTADRLTSAPK